MLGHSSIFVQRTLLSCCLLFLWYNMPMLWLKLVIQEIRLYRITLVDPW